MKKFLFLSTLLSCLMTCGCNTPIEPDHVNKFSCKVNGVFWESVPLQRDILGNDLKMEKSPFFDVGYIHARNVKKDQSIGFDFSMSDTSKTSIISSKAPFADYTRNCNVYNVYHLDTLSNRTVTVTEHDKIKQIIKGNFSFRVINSVGCIDTVKITEGFFDMQYL